MTTDHARIGGTLRIDKWDPDDLARKFEIEARLRAEADAADPTHHIACHTPGDTGGGRARIDTCADKCEDHPALGPGDELHLDCGYTDVHARALAELASVGIAPLESIGTTPNSLVNTGLTDYNNGLVGGSLTVYSNANCGIGAGDSASAVAPGQTDLQALTGATHRYTQALDATYPTVANGVLTFRATFAQANGNFGWQEIVITNNTANLGSTNALTRILDRFLNAAGTKPATQAWQITVTMTLS